MGIFDKLKNAFKAKDNLEKQTIDLYDKGLEKTRSDFVFKLNSLNKKYKKVSNEYFEELEEILIMADIGVNTVMNFIDKLKRRVKSENILDVDDLKEIIVDEMFIIYVNNQVIVNKINYAELGPTNKMIVGPNSA